MVYRRTAAIHADARPLPESQATAGLELPAVILDQGVILTPDDGAATITQDDLGTPTTGLETRTATTSREMRHDQRPATGNRSPKHRESALQVPFSRAARSGPAVR